MGIFTWLEPEWKNRWSDASILALHGNVLTGGHTANNIPTIIIGKPFLWGFSWAVFAWMGHGGCLQADAAILAKNDAFSAKIDASAQWVFRASYVLDGRLSPVSRGF